MAPDAFARVGGDWTPVEPGLATMRRLLAEGMNLLLVLVTVAALAVTGQIRFLVLPLIGGVLAGGGLWWLIGRQVRAIGYAERADDLLVVSGIMVRRLVVVPYGRMQLVDVKRGPLERYFGLATVQLHTAAATTDAEVPGLATDEAARLRDKLALLGEQRSAGL